MAGCSQAKKQLQSSAAEAFGIECWQLFSNKKHVVWPVRVMKNIKNSGQRSASSVEWLGNDPRRFYKSQILFFGGQGSYPGLIFKEPLRLMLDSIDKPLSVYEVHISIIIRHEVASCIGAKCR
jgi:hypothetical protein